MVGASIAQGRGQRPARPSAAREKFVGPRLGSACKERSANDPYNSTRGKAYAKLIVLTQKWERDVREVLSTITTKGQVTIPQNLRQKHGLLPLSEVDFIEQRQGLLLIKSGRRRRGKRIIETMMQGSPVKGTTTELLRMTRGD